MTNTLPFYIVDVFTETRFTGNQLAVIRHAAPLSTETMQAIALEMNYSETTFILSDKTHDGGYDVRIFTTTLELPFAGHPTLGTAYIINHEISSKPQHQLLLNLKVGQILVKFSDDGIVWMRQKPPTFGEIYPPQMCADIAGISIDDIDTRFPIQYVSTGVPTLIMPLKSLAAIRRVHVDRARIHAIPLPETGMHALLFFCPETYQEENDLNARMLFGPEGEEEDPATGSSNGCLAAYLAHYQFFGSSEVNCRVEQGYEVKRPSLLFLNAYPAEDSIAVNVGGGVVMVARGELLV